MTAYQLLIQLQQTGIQLYLEPEGKLRMVAEAPPDATVIAAVAANKTELLDLLHTAPLQELLQLLAPALCSDRANTTFAAGCLTGMKRAEQVQWIQQYQATYQHHFASEPCLVKKENAGTFAANHWLRTRLGSIMREH
ncbi:hypothetical protein QWY20_01055 [Alkalimonas sp. MEB108]|uniref:TubC N-terminal docking domain-containing protein n=1 Tax=Alkalimonas cellulosilytica TaxID=3058395 RepID=A0ABU7J0K0_9GAMM|nr:hypothetical protein [Alkalimonas sp. MEB108]MEE2000025.1 hypothetical protein [Alkalimonas sp. MEB108]